MSRMDSSPKGVRTGLMCRALIVIVLAVPGIAAEVTIIEQEDAIAMAQKYDWPIRSVGPNGRVLELQRVEDGWPVYYVTHNLGAADTISADEVWPGGGAGLTLTGEGVTLGVWDGGRVNDAHQELRGRVVQMDNPFWEDDHATHVTGTMIAAGVDSRARGMSYAATVNAYDFNNDMNEAAAAAAAGLRASNHSYGRAAGFQVDYGFGFEEIWFWYGDTSISDKEDYKFGFYDIEAQRWDTICYNRKSYLPVFSAGNDRTDTGPPAGGVHYVFNPSSFTFDQSTADRNPDGNEEGYDCINGQATCKNGLSVGAVKEIEGGYGGPASVEISTFSSWGPVDDGRVKPDVVAKGVDTYSTLTGSTKAYAEYSGTSMSSPSVTGALGLLIEHYGNTHTPDDLNSAMLKALVIHTTDECGPSVGPDYVYGWGLMNVKKAVDVISRDLLLPATVSLQTLEPEDPESGGEAVPASVTLYAATSTTKAPPLGEVGEPLKVTMVWTDLPGTPVAASLNPRDAMLVNDLDVRVRSTTSGAVYQPWRLDPTTPSAPAELGDNTVDNVEQILVEDPGDDAFEITVTHKGEELSELGAGKQEFAIVITGAMAIGDTLAPLISPQYVVIPEGSSASFSVQLVTPPTDPAWSLAVEHVSGDTGIAITSPSPATLTFTQDNWAVPQTVTLTANSDADACDEQAVIRVSYPAGVDRPSADVNAVAADTDVDLEVSPTRIDLAEGEQGTFTVQLANPPCVPTKVTLAKTGGAHNINIISDPRLTFTISDWDTPREVIVEAAEDPQDFLDGHAEFVVIAETAIKASKTVDVYDEDEDELKVVTSTGQIRVPEGDEVSVLVSLNAPPPDGEEMEVRIERLEGDSDVSVRSGDVLTFDETNWIGGLPVTFSALEDADRVDGSATFRVNFATQQGLFQDLRVTEIENDQLLLELSTSTLEIGEWETVDFGVRLNGEPEGDVLVSVAELLGDPDIKLLGPTTLTFTRADGETPYNVFQYVSVQAVADSDNRNNNGRIQASATGIPAAVVVITEKERVSFARPSTPTSPNPAHLASGVELPVKLAWVGSPIADEYDVYVTTKLVPNEDDLITTTTDTEVEVAGLESGRAYYWRVVSRNSRGVNAGPMWSFSTLAAQPVQPGDPNDPNSPSDPNDPNAPADPNDPNAAGDGTSDGSDISGTDGSTPTSGPCALPVVALLLAGLAVAFVRRPRRQ